MPVMKRRQAVVKRRDISVDYTKIGRGTTMEEALEQAIRIFISEGLRERTIDDYRKFWAEFTEIVGKQAVQDCTVDDIRRYIGVLLRKRRLSPVTVNVRLGGVKSIFTRLENDGIINVSPAAAVPKLRTDEKVLYAIRNDQAKRLFAVIDTNTVAGFRDYCALYTIFKAGLRPNEIQKLEIADVDFENEVFMLPGAKNKNRKNRAVPMSRKIKPHLQQLIAENREYFGHGITHVFLNQFGEPMKEDHLRKRMHVYVKKAGLKEAGQRLSPYSLRHAFAINYLNNGGNIRHLQMILGHAELSTTEIYLDYTDTQVSDGFKKVDEQDTFEL